MVIVEIRGREFNVGPRYDDLVYISEGKSGIVVSSLDKITNRRVAIAEKSLYDSTHCYRAILREIRRLTFFKHENILDIKDIISAPTAEQMRDIFIVQSLMDTNLRYVIGTRQLTEEHIRYFLYQILRGLKYIHSADVTHGHLKPSHILMNVNCHLKIKFFNRIALNEEGSHTSWYWCPYRAPEALCGFHSKPMDVWSVGCILAEMISGQVLFGKTDFMAKLIHIIEVIGTPEREEFDSIPMEGVKNKLMELEPKVKIPWSERLPNGSPQALDLLDKMLTFDPNKRIDVERALKHPYLQMYHDPDDEPVSEKLFDANGDGDERMSLDSSRTLLFQGIENFWKARETKVRLSKQSLKHMCKNAILFHMSKLNSEIYEPSVPKGLRLFLEEPLASRLALPFRLPERA